MYKAYVCELKDIRPHPNANRLNLATVFGSTICVNLVKTSLKLGLFQDNSGQILELK